MSERTHKILVTFFVLGPFIGVLLAIFFTWQKYVFASDIALLLGMHFITALGVTIGYHRMLTHQGFDAPQWLRGIFIALGSIAFAGASQPDEWAATHIKHHALSDAEGDPHSPLEGFWHAHMGWLYSTDVREVRIYAPHLLTDPAVLFVRRCRLLWTLIAFAVPFALGGWTGLLWGGIVRLFLTEHTTWSVNSICHSFGKRPFETTDESRNEWIVGLLAFGEGWHNNHHAFPRNAFHGLHWWQFDLSGLVIRFLEKVGLISHVERVSKELIEAKRIKAESLRETFLEWKTQLKASVSQAQEDLSAYASKLRKEWNRPRKKPFETKAFEELHNQFNASYEEALLRLESLRKNIERRQSMRKQRMEQEREQVRLCLAEAKARLREQARKLAGSLR